MIEPFQNCNSGHHPNGRVMKVIVQHLNYSIKVKRHLYFVRTVGKKDRNTDDFLFVCPQHLRDPVMDHNPTVLETRHLYRMNTVPAPKGLQSSFLPAPSQASSLTPMFFLPDIKYPL